MLLTLLSALIVVTPAGQLSAFERDNLRGVTAVEIVVERLHDDAERCGIRQNDLALSAARPLVDAGIKVVDKHAIYLYIVANILPTSTGCHARIDVSARTFATATLDHGVKPITVLVLLWEDGSQLGGPASNFSTRLNATVREFVDQFATKVKLANAR